jgi:hypothetical protein
MEIIHVSGVGTVDALVESKKQHRCHSNVARSYEAVRQNFVDHLERHVVVRYSFDRKTRALGLLSDVRVRGREQSRLEDKIVRGCFI